MTLRGKRQTITLPCGCYLDAVPEEDDAAGYEVCVEVCPEIQRIRREWDDLRAAAIKLPEDAWPTERVQGPLRAIRAAWDAHFNREDHQS